MEQEKTFSPRYATEKLREANKCYIQKYYYTNGGREKKLIKHYEQKYPELKNRHFYEETDDLKTRLQKIKDEAIIIRMERKLKMRVVVTYEDNSSENGDD